jgi:Rrf2 family protein
MLSLSKKTDYALLALCHLARGGRERAANTREIAEQFDLPVELLAKVLQRLAKANLLVSTSGPTGGYRLARSADEITVGAVVAAVDGTPAIIHCMKTVNGDCGQLTKCTIRGPLERVNARILQMLNLTSLSEIAGDEIGFATIPLTLAPIRPGSAGVNAGAIEACP